MEDYFVDTFDFYLSEGIILDDQQQKYIVNLETIFKGNIRNDLLLLCNIYKLYKSCGDIRSHTVSKDGLACCRLGDAFIGQRLRLTEILAKKFGLSEKYIYTLLKISDRFVDFLAGEKYRINELNDFTVSKLQELLPLSVDTIKQAFASKVLTIKSTRADIRSYVKSLKNISLEKVVEDNTNIEIVEDNPDSAGLLSITFPCEIIDYCRTQCSKRKISISEYLIELVREKM